VGLTTPVSKRFIAAGFLALYTILPLRKFLIEKPYLKPRVNYWFAKSLGSLAGEISKRNTGVLRPDGLMKILDERY